MVLLLNYDFLKLRPFFQLTSDPDKKSGKKLINTRLDRKKKKKKQKEKLSTSGKKLTLDIFHVQTIKLH